jgi:hypothetical protein
MEFIKLATRCPVGLFGMPFHGRLHGMATKHALLDIDDSGSVRFHESPLSDVLGEVLNEGTALFRGTPSSHARLKASERAVRKILLRYPGNLSATDVLGGLIWAQGRHHEAVTLWQSAYNHVMGLLATSKVPITEMSWYHHENRPFFYLGYSLAEGYNRLADDASDKALPVTDPVARGYYESAAGVLIHLMRLNKSDNQGLRNYVAQPLMALGAAPRLADFYDWFYALGQDDDAEDTEPEGEGALGAAWANAEIGRKSRTGKFLRSAAEGNPIMAAALLFPKIEAPLPWLQSHFGVTSGSYHEAWLYHERHARYWQARPKAMAFLESFRPALTKAIILHLKRCDFSEAYFPPASFVKQMGINPADIPPLRDPDAPRTEPFPQSII